MKMNVLLERLKGPKQRLSIHPLLSFKTVGLLKRLSTEKKFIF
jgi:hypothetical protein